MHRFEIIITVALNQILFDLSIFERKNNFLFVTLRGHPVDACTAERQRGKFPGEA